MSMSGGSLKAGDVIEVTVQMINAWQANITFRNHNDPSGKSLRWNRLMYSNTDREKPFYGTDVGWIAEAPPCIRTGRIYIPPLANFGEVVFSACSAETNKGRKLDLTESEDRRLWQMDKSRIAHTEVEVQSVSSFTVRNKGTAKSS
ncbi:hypothetical protein F5878DRAFT_727459 [Lentinula raphanica]|uniref:Uncharacterized protein n=1 Tax=Lentinula raphanica TaxID=153919 RepID=A0AA38P3B7_9AGAR|nr:hypothetical protein F5878DRAFT_727459 [Lentinula raphanica]